MVFPYMAHDLAGLLENKKIERLEPSLLKLYARQLLLGTSYLHRVCATAGPPQVVRGDNPLIADISYRIAYYTET